MVDSGTLRVAHANCGLCEAACGLEVEHDGRRIHSVRGDDEDPFSRGYICPKAVALEDLHGDPDRLRFPLMRVDGELRQVTWAEAFDAVAKGLARVEAAHGRDAIGLYTGNPLGHSYSGLLYSLLFAGVLGSKQRYSAQSVDALPRLFTVFHMYGSQAILPVPDLDRTEYFLILGANPVVSNGSVFCAPNMRERLRALRARGGRVVVIDPRFTETAKEADEHVFIRPGTDALLLAAMLNVIFAEKRHSLGRLAAITDGLSEVMQVVGEFSPERVATTTAISADTIRRLAREFAGTARGVCYGRMGTSTQRFGALSAWFIETLNIVTGNLDREGGSMFNTPAVDLASVAAMVGAAGSYATFRSRVSGLPEFAGELPIAALAEEIETPGQGQIRALVTLAGNPVLSLPNGRRLESAIEKLDFMISMDVYVNETTRHADVILPSTFGFERDDYQVLSGSLGVRNRARFAEAVLEKPQGMLHDWEILTELCARILESRARRAALGARVLRSAMRYVRPRHYLELMLRLGPHGLRRGKRSLSLARIAGHGLDLGPLEARLPGVLATRNRRIRLAPEPLLRDVERLRRSLDQRQTSSELPMLLLGRRQLRSNNSWMHNSLRLVSGRERCTLLVNPLDATRLALEAGALAKISSQVGSVVAPVQISDEMMPGVVSLPHGWGHHRKGVRLRVAEQHAGTSINDVTDEKSYDELCGVTHLNGVPVRVEPVAESAHATAEVSG